MRNVVIAPCGRIYRDRAQIPITDNIIDPVDAVFLKEKTDRIVPLDARKSPVNTALVRYNNLRAVHAGNQYANDLLDQYAVKGAILDKHPMTDISSPDMQSNNNKYLQGGII
jgi:hypothetical protein